MLERALTLKFSIPLFDDKHSLLDNHPSLSAKHVGGIPFLTVIFLSVSLFPKNSVADSWTVANHCLLLFDFRIFSGSCNIPHLSPQEH